MKSHEKALAFATEKSREGGMGYFVYWEGEGADKEWKVDSYEEYTKTIDSAREVRTTEFVRKGKVFDTCEET